MTEKFGTSLYKLYQSIDSILSERYEVHKLEPMYRFFKGDAKNEYLQSYLSCDAAVIGNISTLAKLRNLGWEGKAILTALGSLPRGAAAIRKVLSILGPRDVVLLSSTADLGIWNWFFKSAPRAEVIPFGVDTDVFQPMSTAAIEKLRAQLGYGEEHRLILYSGRITVEKNVHGFLPILADLIREHPNYVLLIAGKFDQVPFRMFNVDVDIEEKIKALVKELSIPPSNLRFLSHLNESDLVKLYNVSDVLINTSLHHDENFGYSQVEAMACGTPVVANAWGGIKDTVKDAWSGYLIPTWVTESGIHFDQQLVTKRLIGILENDRERNHLAANAERWIHENFSMQRFSERLIDVIEDSQTGPCETKFSPRGLKYAWRFSDKYEEDSIVKLEAVRPRFTCYEDEDYVDVIRHYTSRLSPSVNDKSLCYKPSYWHRLEHCVNGRIKIINDDPLWPYESIVDESEIEILEYVFSKEYVAVSTLRERWGNGSMRTLDKLIRKGYLNCSG